MTTARSLSALTLLHACLTLAACSSSTPPSTNTPDAGTADGNPAVADTPAPTDVLAPSDVLTPTDVPAPTVDAGATMQRTLTVPDRMLRPGEEITMCREVRLGNVAEMLVRRIQVSITQGSHHVIVYRSRATEERPELTPCPGLSGILQGTAPIFIAQQRESAINFPEGVGLSIAENQMIRLEEHFVNTSPGPIMAGARITFDLAPAAGLTPADMMFWGTQSINVPPRMMGRAQHFRPALPDINVFGLTSHTHQYGTLATIEVATALMGPGREVHRNTEWEDPPLTLFAPPLRFGADEGLRLTCQYNNTTDRALRFGESYFQEMCFLWAYYYPSAGFHACVDSFCRTLPL